MKQMLPTGGKTTAQGCFQVHIRSARGASRLEPIAIGSSLLASRALEMNDSSEKGFFLLGERLITEVENVFWDTRVSRHAFYVRSP
jgi:hypothetical protein